MPSQTHRGAPQAVAVCIFADATAYSRILSAMDTDDAASPGSVNDNSSTVFGHRSWARSQRSLLSIQNCSIRFLDAHALQRGSRNRRRRLKVRYRYFPWSARSCEIPTISSFRYLWSERLDDFASTNASRSDRSRHSRRLGPQAGNRHFYNVVVSMPGTDCCSFRTRAGSRPPKPSRCATGGTPKPVAPRKLQLHRPPPAGGRAPAPLPSQ